MPNLPPIKLDRGIHAMHLFYRADRERWARLPAGESGQCRARLEQLCAANANPSHPRLTTYANVGAKAAALPLAHTSQRQSVTLVSSPK